MIVGRVVVRDRDLGCVGLIILALRSHRASRVKIPAFQSFGYLTAPVSAVFGGLGCFHHPEHRVLGLDFTLLQALGYPRSASACAAFVW